jgi:3-oxoacyl-[acyl-carrier protein] reductase
MSEAAVGRDRHVLISGGSRGLGKAIVEGLLREGYRASTFSRKATPFVEEMTRNEKFFYQPADLGDGPSLSVFVKAAEAKLGPMFGLVNCAAIAADGLLAMMSEDTISKLMTVNGEGTLKLTRLVVRRMMRANQGGSIVNISSISSVRGFRGLSAYAFTKGGLDAATRSLARELGEQKIRVNSVAPGYYDTEMSEDLKGDQKEQILRRTPLGRLGVPEDVVGAVLFFLSDQASFITGQILTIDGGSTV